MSESWCSPPGRVRHGVRGVQRGVQGGSQGGGAVQQAPDQGGGGRAEGLAVEGAPREHGTNRQSIRIGGEAFIGNGELYRARLKGVS